MIYFKQKERGIIKKKQEVNNALIINVTGYVSHTRRDRYGCRNFTFQFSPKDAVKLAQLDLISQELDLPHDPILLDCRFKRSESSLLKVGRNDKEKKKEKTTRKGKERQGNYQG